MVEVEEIKVKKTTKLNKSAFFILPMLNISFNNYKKVIKNVYLRDFKYQPELDNYYIFVLCHDKLGPDDPFRKNAHYIKTYHTEKGIMYVFKTPKDLEEDYLKFILGKYSEFSGDYKKMIVKSLPTNYQKTNIFKVIMKSSEAKKLIEDRIGCSIGDQEVMSIPDIDEESYG